MTSLTNKIMGLVGAYVSLEGAKKFMEISDDYTNTNSKLSLITNNLTQQKALQQEIFAAADRARGSYTTMADTVAKLGVVNMDKFGSTSNIVKFTETMQKLFKINGTNTAGQSGAMLQIQQAIGLGRLQGQDLKILEEDMPMIANVIAKYMHKSAGEVRSLGTAGEITSSVLINSILDYSGTVDKQMSKMSYTWGDYWNKIINGAIQAFSEVFDNESKLLGSQNFKNMINGIIGAFSVLANAANQVLTIIASVGGFITQNWPTLEPIILSLATAFVIVQGAMMGVAAAGALIDLVTSPIFLIIAALGVIFYIIFQIVSAVRAAQGQTTSALGILGGAINWLIVLFQNFGYLVADTFIAMWAMISTVAENIKTAFGNAWVDMQTGFWKFVSAIISGVTTIIGWVNKIPGVNIDTSGLENAAVGASNQAASAWASRKGYKDVSAATTKAFGTYKVYQTGWSEKAWNAGYNTGSGIEKSIGGKLTNLATFGTASKPAVVKGTGTGGNVSVNMADQDLQYLRDLAEKEYVNKFSTATLAPSIQVKFTGPISKEVDTNQMYTRMGKILKQQITTAASGRHTK